MPFEIFRPDPSMAHSSRLAAKITVTHTRNGRSRIGLSTAARDWLQPTPGDSKARYPWNQPSMKVVILVDRGAHQVMLQRAADSDADDHVHEVHGMNSSGTAYITGWRFSEQLGLDEGHYSAQLVPETDTGTETGPRALLFDTRAGTAIKRQPRRSAQADDEDSP